MRGDGESTTSEALERLTGIAGNLKAELSKLVEVPEASWTLNVESRANDLSRVVKHIHQTCVMHRGNYVQANRIKLAYLVDGYISLVGCGNPLGIYASARGLLEFHAYLHYVAACLTDVLAPSGQKTPEERGREFFRVLIRARFGTSDPRRKRTLTGNGLHERYVKPFHVNACIRRLMQDRPTLDWIEAQYDFLCDFVHHNLGSQAAARIGDRLSGELEIGPIRIALRPESILSRYEHPSRSASVRATAATAEAVLVHVDGAIDALGRTPWSPFSSEELEQLTGSKLGMPVRDVRAMGRNERCPCGSGKKYKTGHGR